jgi:hypothetical protein
MVRAGRQDGLFVALMLFAVEAGEINEMGACQLLEWERSEFRDHKQKTIDMLRASWQEWRAAHPVKV